MISGNLRRDLRRTGFGLATVLGLARRGFFIPYRYAAKLPPAGEQPAYAAAERRLAAAAPAFAEVLEGMQELAAELRAIGRPETGAQAGAQARARPRWDQDWFPGLDAAAAYCLTRRLQPARVVEVGSGHSTRFYARAIADGGLATRLQTVDPAPRAGLRGLGVEHVESTLQEAPPEVFAGLAAGDLLSIDSSHILMPGSDVDHLFSRVLPELPAGALLQIHDVFLPDDYPVDWAWRAYNEQLAVLQLLVNGGWEPLFASHYVRSRMSDRLSGHVMADLPLIAGARESSLWLRRKPG